MCVEKHCLRQSREKPLVCGRILDWLTTKLTAGTHQELAFASRPDRYGDPHLTRIDVPGSGYGSEADLPGIKDESKILESGNDRPEHSFTIGGIEGPDLHTAQLHLAGICIEQTSLGGDATTLNHRCADDQRESN
jgi:hypothetical protein